MPYEADNSQQLLLRCILPVSHPFNMQFIDCMQHDSSHIHLREHMYDYGCLTRLNLQV